MRARACDRNEQYATADVRKTRSHSQSSWHPRCSNKGHIFICIRVTGGSRLWHFTVTPTGPGKGEPTSPGSKERGSQGQDTRIVTHMDLTARMKQQHWQRMFSHETNKGDNEPRHLYL